MIREGDTKPEAVLRFRDTALLLAASLPVTGRGTRYWTELEPAEGKKPVVALKTVVGEHGLATMGRLRSRHDELLAYSDGSVVEQLVLVQTVAQPLVDSAHLLAGRLRTLWRIIEGAADPAGERAAVEHVFERFAPRFVGTRGAHEDLLDQVAPELAGFHRRALVDPEGLEVRRVVD